MTVGQANIPDLSHHNPISNLPTLAAAAAGSGIILKASEGQTWVDPTFRGRAAHLTSVPLGAYHFARPDPTLADPRTEGRLEARHFANTTSGHTLALGRFLDWEATRGNSKPIDTIDSKWTKEWIAGWLTIVPDGVVYASLSVCEGLLGDFPLWVAAWEQTPPQQIGDHPVILHQHTDRGAFPGIGGEVDLSRPVTSPA